MDPKSLTLKGGDSDPFGNVVSRVFATSEEKKYAIRETTKGSILCDADGDELAKAPELSTWVVRVAGLISRRKKFDGKYSSQIAYAYKLCYDGDKSGAVGVLKTTHDEIVGLLKTERRSRAAYLMGALSLTAISELAWLVSKVEEANHSALGSFDSVFAGVAVAALGG